MSATVPVKIEPRESSGRFPGSLSQAALVLALALTVARCIMLPPESIREPFAAAPGAEPYPLGANAVTSLALDLFCCLPAMLVLLRRLLDKQFTLAVSLGQIILLPLLTWMALSIRWADDKFIALVSVANVIAAFALFWAACQLVRNWLRLRLVAAVAFGLLMIILPQGFYYRFVEVPETQAFFREHKQDFLRQRGWKPDDFNATQYEKKIMSGEMMVFNTSPNSFAAILTLLMLIAIALALQRIVDRDPAGWAVAILLTVPFSIWLLCYTYSKAAIAAPALGAMLLACAWIFRQKLATRSTALYFAGVAIVFLAVIAVVAHGLHYHTLPTASLNFRWRYWIAAARIFNAHPLFGVGWNNFGLHYLRYRLPVASEEIKDPHNFIIRFFVELGAVGGVLLLAALLRISWELTRPISPADPLPTSRRTRFPRAAPGMKSLLWLAILALAINTIAGVDFSQNWSFLTVEFSSRLLWLCALSIGMLIANLKSIEPPEIDDRHAPWILVGLLVAIGVFLVHNLIEFSLFEPGTMCLFAVLCGAALGMRQPESVSRRPTIIPATFFCLAITGLIAFAILIVLPIAHGESDARRGDEALRTGHFQEAVQDYQSASGSVFFNADYAFRASRALGLQAQLARAGRASAPPAGWVEQAISLLKIAADRNPSDLDIYLAQARLAELRRDTPALIAGYEKTLQLNPNEVSIRLEYARALQNLGLTAQSKEQYQLALSFNSQLDEKEPKRLSPRQIDEVQKRLADMK